MLILAISTRGCSRRSRFSLWLFTRIFKGLTLVFKDPFTIDMTTLPMTGISENADIIEPQTLRRRHEIKITINPEADAHGEAKGGE